MSNSLPRIAYLTAGAAGMYCGSCMHDNTLARALAKRNVDIQLIPTYTPIRTDETDVSIDRVFFGGVNVYLQQNFPLFRHLPAFVDRFFDQAWLMRIATARGVDIDAKELGALTVSMLRGESGFQRKEVQRLVAHLKDEVKPHIVATTNMLIAGCAGSIKSELGCPLVVTLQGDDIFLEELPEPHRQQALDEIRRLGEHIDGFLVHSEYYKQFMSEYLQLPLEKFHITPLGIDIEGYDAEAATTDRPPTVGYLARLAKEKGLHQLVDAFIQLRKLPGMEKARLRIAGWLGERNKAYAEEQFQKLRDAGLEDAFEYVGEVDRLGKIAFLKNIDVLCTPTVYRDPKGLFVLEALAAGTPVVQPDHGAFPEMIAATGGGELFRPGDSQHLVEVLFRLLLNPVARRQLATAGREAVLSRFHADAMAENTLAVFQRFLPTWEG